MINSVFHQGIDPWSVQSIGSFDYARAKQGGLDVAVEHLYIEDDYNKYNYTIKQALRLIEPSTESLKRITAGWSWPLPRRM